MIQTMLNAANALARKVNMPSLSETTKTFVVPTKLKASISGATIIRSVVTAAPPMSCMIQTALPIAVHQINDIGYLVTSNTPVSDKLKKVIGGVPLVRKVKCTSRQMSEITRNMGNVLALMDNGLSRQNMPAGFVVPKKSKASIYGATIIRSVVMKVHQNSSTAQQASDVAGRMRLVLIKTAIAVTRRTN